MRIIPPLFAALLSALLLSLSFPKFDMELLAWAGIIPLFYLMERSSSKGSFLWGWFSGTLFFAITLRWLIGTMHHYGGLPSWLGALVLLLLSLYLGLYSGLFTLLTKLIRGKMPVPLPFIAAPLWVSLEYLRGHLFSGFPWASLGYSQYKLLPIVQIADVTSFPGISFLIVAVNAALFELLICLKERSFRPSLPRAASLFAVVLLFLGSLIYGYQKLQTTYERPGSESNVAVLQGNIPQDLKWDRHFQRKTIDIYTRLTAEARKGGADFVIWPETAAPFFFQDLSEYRQELFRVAMNNQVDLLFGSPSYAITEGNSIKLFNSAYLISPSGETPARYDKIHLVPFGEYVPLSGILFFIEKMVVGIGDFLPGENYTVLQGSDGKFGVVICFEVIFPDLVRRFVLNGAEFMTTITNDAWFGDSAAPYQHFAMVVFRAVENRVYFARAANTGISGFISPKGEIMGETPLFEESSLIRGISPSASTTFYTRHGDLFPWLCLTLTGLFIGLSFKRTAI